MKKLKKVIIPIAGLGTRMLPATKAIPKEMLPVAGKPIIQYVVEEAVDAGFKEIIFITHSSKSSVENHFDTSFELEAELSKRVRRSLLKEIKSISKLNILISSIRQGKALGLGHAILCAKTVLNEDEPFAILLPDVLIDGSNENNNLAKMKKEFEASNNSSILLGKIDKKNTKKYGIAKVKKNKKSGGIGYIENIVEKPNSKRAPSNLFAVGRYIFSHELISFLSKTKADKNGEIQLTDAIDDFLKFKKVVAHSLDGKFYDCGEKLGYLIANIEFSMKDNDIKKNIKSYFK